MAGRGAPTQRVMALAYHTDQCTHNDVSLMQLQFTMKAMLGAL
jgi:hypothetical protein